MPYAPQLMPTQARPTMMYGATFGASAEGKIIDKLKAEGVLREVGTSKSKPSVALKTASDLKKEFGSFWDKYWIYITIGSVLAVGGGVGYWYYRRRRR